MRIAILANVADETGGGAGRIAQVYLEALKARGHEVATWGPKPWFSQLGKVSSLQRLYWHVTDLGAWHETVQRIRDWKPDVLLTHNLTGCGFGTAAKIQAAGIRWVHILHDVQLIEPSGQIRSDESVPALRHAWRFFWSRLRQMAFGHPHQIVSPTNWLLAFHASWNWFVSDATCSIPNPIQEKNRHVEKVSGRVVYVGRFESDKGFDLLLEAWDKTWQGKTELYCIGDGSLNHRAQQLKTKRVVCLGWKTANQVLQEMAQAEVVIVPSRLIENQPTVILEAFSQNCQVIASNVGGIPETLAGLGQIFDIAKKDGLTKALIAYNERDRSKKQFSTEGVLALHNLEQCVTQLEAVLIGKR